MEETNGGQLQRPTEGTLISQHILQVPQVSPEEASLAPVGVVSSISNPVPNIAPSVSVAGGLNDQSPLTDSTTGTKESADQALNDRQNEEQSTQQDNKQAVPASSEESKTSTTDMDTTKEQNLKSEVKQEAVNSEESQDFKSNKTSIKGKNEVLELATGEEVLEEANKIFNSSNKFGPKVSMAFKVVKKAKNKEGGGEDGHSEKKKKKKKKKDKKEKKVKVVFTSKKALEAAMKAAESGQDPAEVMKRLNGTVPPSPKPSTSSSKEVPLTLQPTWSVIDQLGKSLKDIPEDLVDEQNDLFNEYMNDGTDFFDPSSTNNDVALDESLIPPVETKEKTKKKKSRPKSPMYKDDELIKDEVDEDPDYLAPSEYLDYDMVEESSSGTESEDYDDNDSFIDDREFDDEDDESRKKRKKRKRRSHRRSSSSYGGRARRLNKVKNTLDKSKGFYSLNIDDYVVAYVESGRTSSTSQSRQESIDDDEVKQEFPSVKKESGSLHNGEGENSLTSGMSDNSNTALSLKDEKKPNADHTDSAKVFGCVYCDYTGRKQNWLIHIRTKHKDKKIFFCSRHRVCAMPFNSQKLLDKHTEIAHKQEHACPTCNKVYRYPSQLSKHMQSHLSEDSEEKRKHICPYCGKKFSTRSGYRSHEAHYHTLDLRHKCDWEGCNKAYFSLNDLKIHRRGHTGELPYTCSYCGTGFVAKCRLVQHEKVIHLRIGKQKVECEICHKMIRQKHMSFHLKTHQGLTTAWCSVCGKGFPTNGGKRRHEKIHFNIKNYACRFCGKAFVQKANMEAHERIHTGVKPYACKYCGECFVQGTRRNQHQNACRHKPSDQQQQQQQPQGQLQEQEQPHQPLPIPQVSLPAVSLPHVSIPPPAHPALPEGISLPLAQMPHHAM